LSLLQVEEVSVRFGGLLAVDMTSFTVDEGRITGLIGPNGAGKTTMFNVITGLQRPNIGRVLYDGRDITEVKPHKRARLGIARTFQRLEVFGSLTARENILVAAEKRHGAFSSTAPKRAGEVLERVGLTAVADEHVDQLPTGTARLVELARALATEPRVLLLDEPSSGLDDEETDEMSRLLLSLAADGLGILLVEHDVAFVMGTCAELNVLDFGRIIARGTPEEIQANPAVQTAYLGTGAG
jgi:branched-chain amino acid transport system ATP-binding protein